MTTHKKIKTPEGGALIAAIGDEDTITGLLLAGVGDVNQKRNKNFMVVDNKTKLGQIEETFKEYTSREDVGIVLISQHVASDIRHLLEDYDKLVPTVLEIPSKGLVYDLTKDSIMIKVARLLGSSLDQLQDEAAPGGVAHGL
jgi:V-type H+-transporting ATPase subunit F